MLADSEYTVYVLEEVRWVCASFSLVSGSNGLHIFSFFLFFLRPGWHMAILASGCGVDAGFIQIEKSAPPNTVRVPKSRHTQLSQNAPPNNCRD